MSWQCERLKGAACTEPHPHPSIVVVEGLNLDKPTTLTFCWFQFAIHKKGQFESRATEDYYALQYFNICWICFESEKTNTFCSLSATGKWFSLILCTSENSSFEKRRNITTKCIKQFFYLCCVVPNLVVDIDTFNFCLFVCTSRFANFAKGKCSNYDSKNCSEIRTVTW